MSSVFARKTWNAEMGMLSPYLMARIEEAWIKGKDSNSGEKEGLIIPEGNFTNGDAQIAQVGRPRGL